MPQVPYNPVPTVEPSGQGQPTVQVSTPEAAFGGTVATAVQSLGKSVEGVGNELFARAQAMQSLRNETEAREADAQYMIEVGKLHAEFSSLEGKAAVDAYPQYAQNMQDLRKQFRGGLSNPEAQRMFDSNSLSTMGRTIFNGAGHAATQQKQWAIGTAEAQIDLDGQTVSDNPNDDVLFQDKLNRTKSNVENRAALKGFDPGSAGERDMQLKAASLLWSRRIQGLNQTSPFKAQEMLDAHRGELTETDFNHLTQIVTSKSNTVESSNIANDVYNTSLDEDGNPKKSFREMQSEVEARARKAQPDNPVLEQHAVAALRTKFGFEKFARSDEDAKNREVVVGGFDSAKSWQELTANPQIEAALNALPATKREALHGQYDRFVNSRDKATHQANFFAVMGMADSPDPQARKEFLDLDPTVQNLSPSDQRKVYALQVAKRKSAQSDPRVTHALGILRPDLQAANIDPNKDFKFRGALQDALTEFKIQYQTEPKAQDIKAIGARLMQEEADPHPWFGGIFGGKSRVYEMEPSSKDVEDFLNDPRFKNPETNPYGVKPTEEMARREYVVKQYQKFFNVSNKTNKGDQWPTVPKSQ